MAQAFAGHRRIEFVPLARGEPAHSARPDSSLNTGTASLQKSISKVRFEELHVPLEKRVRELEGKLVSLRRKLETAASEPEGKPWAALWQSWPRDRRRRIIFTFVGGFVVAGDEVEVFILLITADVSRRTQMAKAVEGHFPPEDRARIRCLSPDEAVEFIKNLPILRVPAVNSRARGGCKDSYRLGIAEGIKLLSRRGTEEEFSAMAEDQPSPVLDSRPKLNPDMPETRCYRAILTYRSGETQLSDEIRFTAP